MDASDLPPAADDIFARWAAELANLDLNLARIRAALDQVDAEYRASQRDVGVPPEAGGYQLSAES
jgi:hypothetical protein